MKRIGVCIAALAIVAFCPLAGIAAETGGPANAAGEVNDPARHHCAGEISAPLTITIDDPASVVPGTSFSLRGNIFFEKDAPRVKVSFLSDGPLGTSAAPIETGPMFSGESLPFDIPVSCQGYGNGLVHVLVEISDELGEPWYAKRESFYGLLRESGNRYGRGGFMALQIEALEDDMKAGLLTEDAAIADFRKVRRMTPVETSRPPGTPEVPDGLVAMPAPQFPIEISTPDAPSSNSVQPYDNLGFATSPLGSGAPPISTAADDGPGLDATITIQGQMRWMDENGVYHPVFGATIVIRDDDFPVDETVTSTVTDANGNYSVVVDNDDGFLQGNRDIYIRYRTANGWIVTKPTGLFADAYEADSGVTNEVPDGTVLNISFDFPSSATNDANSVFQAATWIAAYTRDVNGDPAQVDVIWPNGDTLSFYDGDVQIEQPDRWDWDTIHHEYGHYVMDFLNIENNPGGAHGIGDCAVDERGDDKSEGNRLAWGEGWPTYFGTSGQFELNMAALNVPRVGDAGYDDLEDGSVSYDLEPQDNNGRGEDNELAVQRLLWDLYDTNADSRDNISLSHTSIWNTIKAAGGSPHILSHYWAHLRSGKSNQTQILMGEIATDHQIGPPLNFPSEGTIVSPSNNTFSWDVEVGCPGSYSSDQYDLVFYDASTFNKLLTKAGLTSTTHDLSLADLQTLTATTHDVLWGVEGYHTPSPGTGPYLGETFAITVNQPPVADAGPDQTVECTSPTTTDVTLNGLGSSDPDGDPLTYSWSAPGVVFDDSTSATPTGAFPFSPPDQTTTATLTVSDGLESDMDTVDVTVADTTKPVITCPDDIVVECSATGGTPASDPQLAPFFGGVSATDTCDVSPVITNDAPGFFANGATTTVTFTATDDSGNFQSCQANVTIVDTTPPDISVEVTPDVLWPPNHKFWTITSDVTVVDICDPNPAVTLESIVSDEAPNGIGDGNTDKDIQNADFGTDDREFDLRAERKGNGDGRVYTITHRATDMDGNFAEDSAEVRVPHDQSGMAKSVDGFTEDGTALVPGTLTYRIVIPSVDGMDASTIDAARAYIGNHNGVQVPLASEVVVSRLTGRPDLYLTYDAGFVSSLQALSVTSIGLHYQSGDGTDYSVGDIFGLGAPVSSIALPTDPPADDETGTVQTSSGFQFSM